MKSRLLFWIALILLGISVFAQIRNFEFVVYDDLPFIEANPYVNEGFTKEGVIWAFTYKDFGKPLMHQGIENVWHPLTWLTFMADIEIHGLNAGGFHLTNLFFHLLSTLLVFELTRTLFAKPWVAFFCAALFCLHPLHVETTVWIAERKGVMSGTFFFATLLAYIHWCRVQKPVWYAAALALFALGLMAKPSILILPLILMLVDLFPLHRGPSPEKDFSRFVVFHLKEKWPFYVLTLGAFAIGMILQGSGTHKDFMGSYPLTMRLETMSTSFFFYLKRMFWPADLTIAYSYFRFPYVRYVHLALSLLVAAGTIAMWQNRRRVPTLVFAWGWFLICILPVAGFAYVGISFTTDRYSYLALNGIFTSIGLAGAFWAAQKPGLRRPLIGLGLIAVGACAWLSFKQAQIWKDSESLFTHAIKAQPRNLLGYTNLGGIWQQRNDYHKALKYYKLAEEIVPRDHLNLYNLANNYSRTGSKGKAIEYYKKCLDSYEKYPAAHFNLGLLYSDPTVIGYDPEKAGVHINRACELTQFRNPRYTIIYIEKLMHERQLEKAHALWKQISRFPIREEDVRKRVEATGRRLGLQK